MLSLAGCVGSRMGTSWSAVGMATIDGKQNIVVSYNGDIAIVNPQNGTRINLINPATGEVRRQDNGDPRSWLINGGNYEGAQFYANPIAIDDETLLAPAYNMHFLEVDLVSADVNRSITGKLTGHVVDDILLENGIMYIPYQLGGITAMTLDDFETLWTYPTKEGVWATPLIVEDMLIFTSLDHFIYALNVESGELVWKIDLEGAVGSTPLYANDRLYVGTFAKKVYEIDLDGEILNSYDTQNWVWSTPALEDNIIYVSDLSGYVHALDINNGLKALWSVDVATRGIRSAPLLYDNYVVVASRDGHVYWLDKRNGTTVYDQEIEGNPEILSDLLLLEPSETLDIDSPLIVVSTVNTTELLVAFDVGESVPYKSWVYKQ